MGSEPVRAGERLGDYVVGPEIGRGGFAWVYEGRHVTTGAAVALKILRPEKSADRFVREAEALARLDHPSLVAIHGGGVSARGVPFLAMERVVGETLQERLRRDRVIDPESLAVIADQVLAGLEVAHAQGIVHRDLKPSNILLTLGPRGTEVKLIDFGVCHVASAERLTATGALIGTPGYLAPEMVAGHPHDHRVDLWSLGVVVYEAATGRRVFPPPIFQALQRILDLDLPPVDAAPPRLRPFLAALLAPVERRAPNATAARAHLAADRRRTLAAPTTRRLLVGDTDIDRGDSVGAIAAPAMPASPRPPAPAPPAGARPLGMARGALLGAGAVLLASLAFACAVGVGVWLQRDPGAPPTGATAPVDPYFPPAPRVDSHGAPLNPDRPDAGTCPEAYACCLEAVHRGSMAVELAEDRLRCATRTAPGPRGCQEALTRFCAGRPTDPCGRLHACCVHAVHAGRQILRSCRDTDSMRAEECRVVAAAEGCP